MIGHAFGARHKTNFKLTDAGRSALSDEDYSLELSVPRFLLDMDGEYDGEDDSDDDDSEAAQEDAELPQGQRAFEDGRCAHTTA